MRKLLFFSTLCFVQIYLSGQAVPKMPEILPASPEASSINKAAQLSVSKNTGAANVSIPLYDLKLKEFTLPVSLDYNTNGIKVDEIPGRTGLGWSLNGGGVVTRIVHGKPDDLAVRASLPSPANFDTLNITYGTDQAGQNTLGFLENATYVAAGGTDTEPDEFRISAPGLSVKFIIDLNGNIIQFPFSNIKIQVIGGNTASSSNPFDEIIVTNTNGIKYTFGGYGAVETTISHGLQRIGNFSNIRTGFFLRKIDMPNGQHIDFTYTPISIYCYHGISHGILISLPTNLAESCPYSPGEACALTSAVSETINSVGYQTVYLTSISSSPTDNVNFTYENRPDNGGDKRLKQININYGGYSRVYYLTYEDPQFGGYPAHSMNAYNKRFFLKELYYLVANEDTGNDTLRHKFEYLDIAALPPRLSYAQDHYGFFNGAVNTNLLPAGQLLPSENVAVSPGAVAADRNPNGSKAMKGTLNKVIFPTGGFEELEYEPNYYGKYEQVNTITAKTVSGSGNSDGYGSYLSQTFYTETFNILFNQTVNLSLSVYANPACSNCTPPPMNVITLAKIEVMQNGVSIWSNIERSYNTTNFNAFLNSGNNYSLKLTVWGLPNAATAQISYDYSNGQPQYAWANYEAGGIRVKKILAYDAVSNKTTNTYYRYAQLDSLNKSSGVFEYNVDYKYYRQVVSICGCTEDCELYAASYLTCNHVGLASNSNTPIYMFDNNHIGYTYVVESDDPDFKNGATEYQFSVYPIYNSTLILGYHVKNNVPANTVATSSGYNIRTAVYNNNKKKLRETLNYYSWGGIDTIQQMTGWFVNRRYSIAGITILSGQGNPVGLVAPTIRDRFKQFDLIQYTYISSIVRLDSTISIEYDINNNNLKSKLTYYYGTPANILPIKTETSSSANELITTEMKYPTDYSSQPYVTMVNKNIISPAIETKQKRGATDISLIRNNYKQWYSSGNSIIIEPEYITAKKGTNAEETRIRYHAYDETGNPLDVSKENGSHVSYIWDYNKNFPVAEFRNASILTDSIAYSSFETDGKGYWVFSGAPVYDPSAPMGTYAYNLNGGSISRNTNPTKSYFITYWLKNGSGTVSVNGSAQKILISRNGWTCYEHMINNPSNISVSGTATIDELRLYPAGSYVISFTYLPYLGVKSRNEPNNQISYYEYDAGMRLKLIRDGDKNIIKQFDYQYKKQIYPCVNTAASWVVTGTLRCVKTTDHTNNNTGVQEREERDMNNCSLTYLQIRWVSLGVNGQCPPVANCSGPDKRVINGVCTTGWKVLVSSQQTGVSQWLCTWHYVWSDGFVGPDFTETSSTSCGMGGGGPE